MLREGDIIRVDIIKETETPKGDSILLAVYQGSKFIIQKKLFVQEHNLVGSAFDCYVDKVNCSGQIFIEPLENKKLIGKTQVFKIIDRKTVLDSLGIKKYLYSLENSKKQKAHVLSYKTIQSTEIACKIIGVKKALLIVSLIKNHELTYHENQTIEVSIIEEKTIGNIGNCLIVKDKENHQHLISLAKFQHYNLEKKNSIICSILGFDKLYNHKLEPKNPLYSIGKTYRFKPIRIDKIKDETGTINLVLIVVDDLGMEASITQVSKDIDLTKKIKAIVHRINNGRLYLYQA